MTTATGGAGRRFALLLALRDSEYARKVYGGYYNVFVSAFGGEGEKWDCFRVVDGEFPAAEDLARYDGFVVTGSPHDAYGDDAWIPRLCLLIQTLHAMKKRVLGVCFGHQVLCRALGGRVAKARTGWDVGVRKVTLAQDFLEGFDFIPGDLEQELPRQSANIIEVHQDEVWEIPPRARVLAYSEKTRVEAFAVGEHALGIQGHPEYTTDILHNLIDRLVNNGSIERRMGEDARQTAPETGGPDRAFWTALCKRFLRGGGGEGNSSRHAAATVAPEPLMQEQRAPVFRFESHWPHMLGYECVQQAWREPIHAHTAHQIEQNGEGSNCMVKDKEADTSRKTSLGYLSGGNNTAAGQGSGRAPTVD